MKLTTIALIALGLGVALRWDGKGAPDGKPGPQLRYEARGYQDGLVRMVHPDGREAWGPRSNVKAMEASGWQVAEWRE